MRAARVKRETRETRVEVEVCIDGRGRCRVSTTVPLLDHMLSTLCVHSHLDLSVEARGDLVHHIIEDTSIALGKAIGEALGDRSKLRRFGYARVPMDEALAEAAIDLATRPYAVVDLKTESIEGVEASLISHFISSLAFNIPATIHVSVVYGCSSHHKVEAAFKALALALREAWTPTGYTASTKGVC